MRDFRQSKAALETLRRQFAASRPSSGPSIADVDVVPARCAIDAGLKAQCDVAVAGCVVKERTIAAACIGEAGSVAIEGKRTGFRVANPGCGARERNSTTGLVLLALCIVGERLSTGWPYSRGRLCC